MALIRCPECGNSISDRAEKCPHCGLPASYFSSLSKNAPHMEETGLDYKNLQNVLISFERDHTRLFSAEHYISHRDAQRLRNTYGKYNESLTNKLIFQYVCNNAAAIRVDIDLLRRFLRQMQSLDGDITAHNSTYVDRALEQDKDYFDNKLIIFMMKFIEQYKTTGYDDGGFTILREKTDNPRTLLFLDIAEQVYHHYQSVLKQRNQIDFADMINDAHFYLQEIERQNVTLPYKYIIIDEFQDIARQRFNLTKRLSQITQAKVVAVGDDWQSIYAFSGSDITLFTRFLELMGAGTELKITHTYRNSQELIDIAGGFVQRNTSQIRKRLISPKHLENPIVLEVFDDSIKPMERLADTIEHVIGEIISEYSEQSSILLIGRYNYDMYKLYRTNRFSELPGGAIRSEKYPNAKITFMTAHSSKGLGYDNVILINMFEGKFGFPCQIEDDPIIKLVTYEDNSMPFAEERRLFYVAMTRTKNRVYIAAPKTKPSRFLVELIKDFNIPYNDEINMQVVDLFNLRCPVCGFPLKYEFNKNYGLNLWICTNEAELCDFMTNDRTHMHDILKCPKCTDGYLIVRKNPKNGDIFYGCSNYFNEERKCTHMVPLESGSTNDQ